MSPDSVPEPPAPEAASRIGSVLAAAERQVADILAQAERRAADVHAESARRLQARADDLDEIARHLVAAASTAQDQLDRLRALRAVDLPGGGGTTGGAAAPAAPQDAPAAASAVGDRPTVSGAASTDGVTSTDGAQSAGGASSFDTAASTPEATDDGGSANGGSPLRAVEREAGTTDGARASTDVPGGADARPLHVAPPIEAADDAPDGGADGAGILHRPDDWVGSQDDAVADEARDPEPQPTALDDMPIIAQSDGADYPSDPPEKVDSARLVALSMAANGRSREEVEAHVRDELGIKDHASLIDYVFGISAPSSIVPSWPPRRRRRP